MDPRSRTLASAIPQLAHALGIRVVAERVESEDQTEFLRPQGDAMQGFHFAQPMAAEELTAWLQVNAPPASSATVNTGTTAV